VTAFKRFTTAAAVLLASVGALVTVAGPTQSQTTAERDDDATLGVDAAQVVTADDGGEWANGVHLGEYTTFGTKWDHTDLTFGFVNHTPDLSVASQEAAIAAALNTWASVSPFTFTKVADCDLPFNDRNCTTPDIRVQFGSGDHGGGPDDPDFDGPGGTAAHGFYPPPNGQSAAGDLHLDEAEHWSTSGTGVDLQSIATHELGHSLGLTHATALQCPNNRTSPSRPTMCPVILGTDRTLAQDDINGIQHLYGPPPFACGGRAVTVDLAKGQRPTNGADVIMGTPGNDTVNAGSGADIVCTGGGDDHVDLGPGNDHALTGAGNDAIYGRTGADKIEGGSGNDRAYGGDNNDQVYGGVGNDTIDGGTASDKLYGGAQGDSCNGRGGRDSSSGCERRLGIEALLR
jgi:Ca2+-binding RTX toxin-like protein